MAISRSTFHCPLPPSYHCAQSATSGRFITVVAGCSDKAPPISVALGRVLDRQLRADYARHAVGTAGSSEGRDTAQRNATQR